LLSTRLNFSVAQMSCRYFICTCYADSSLALYSFFLVLYSLRLGLTQQLSTSLKLPRVYIRLCKHGKRFLFVL
jgi:hypothetical protein